MQHIAHDLPIISLDDVQNTLSEDLYNCNDTHAMVRHVEEDNIPDYVLVTIDHLERTMFYQHTKEEASALEDFNLKEEDVSAIQDAITGMNDIILDIMEECHALADVPND